jgi:RHS repeat-associated protein
MTTAAGTTAYAYDNADQLTSVTTPGQGATSYSYDASGNVTSKGSGTSFSWNATNQLVSAQQNGVTQSSTYTGDGLRLSRHDSSTSTTTYFVWDVAGTGQVIDDGASQYLYGPGGLLSRVVNGATYYYLTDALGSTLAIVDSHGSLQQDYVYYVYGGVTQQQGSLGSEFQFAGQETDPTGLQYLRARYYDPTTGRFLSRDPLPACIYDPASHHPYAYAAENPASITDPTGWDSPSGGPHPQLSKSECYNKAIDIEEYGQEVARRYNELVDDPNQEATKYPDEQHLNPKTGTSYKGHQAAFETAQENLRDALKAYGEGGCSQYNKVPDEYQELAKLSTPQPSNRVLRNNGQPTNPHVGHPPPILPSTTAAIREG